MFICFEVASMKYLSICDKILVMSKQSKSKSATWLNKILLKVIKRNTAHMLYKMVLLSVID